MRFTNILFTLLFLLPFQHHAQNNFSTLGESALSLNHNVSQNYGMNMALRSRYILYSDFDVQYLQQQVDFLHFSSLKLSYNHRLSLGFLYRNRDWFQKGSDEFRLTEQFNYTKQKLGVRYGHRIRAEQRFFKTSTVYRQRYRFAVDFPLNGEKLDIGETYLISAVESLLSLSGLYRPETDLRLTAQIGWQLSQTLKLQTGLEHRLEAFNLEAFNTLFVLTSAVIKI